MPKAMLQRLLHNGLQYARVRAELLELELTAERQRVGAMLWRGLLLTLAAWTCIQFVAVLIVAGFWDTPWRLHAIVALIAVALAGTTGAWFALQKLRREPARPLAAALRELDELGDAASERQ